MTQLLHTLFDMSLTAAFVAVVVFLLRLVLKGRVARQMVCLLWLIVFARLLIPVTLQSPVSLVPNMDEVTDPTPVVSEEPEAVPTQPVNTSPVATSPVQGGMTEAPPVVTGPVQNPVVTIPPNVSAPQPVVSAPVTELPPVEEVPPVTEEPPTPFPWATVLTVVWAVGVAAMLVYGVGSYLSIRRKLRFAIRTKEGWWEDPKLRSPFILGLVRPNIYLPCHMTPYARQFILCHERAHIRRGDHIVKPICWLALAIHWFNPLAWVAFLLLSRDIEVACDEKVLRELGSEVKADYSATLLALATNGRFPAPTPLAFGEGDAKTRIKGVLSFKKPALWVTIAAVVVAIVAAVCLLTDPVDKFDPDDYITYDYYPGLYFEEVTDERTGETTVKAYKLENNKPVLVAGWSDQPADNLVTLIHPDGEKEVLLASQWEMTYRYEQYLVDYMMEQDEGWAEYYLTKVNRISPYEPTEYPVLSTVHGEAALTREGNMLLYWNKRVQILPLQPSITDARSYEEVQYHTADIDGFDGLTILWKEGRKVYSPDPSGTLLFKGDALITYVWDGETWTAHDSLDAIAYADKPVSFDAEDQIITVEYDPNAYTNNILDAVIPPTIVQKSFPIPEELGHVATISISGQAQIARRADGDYDLTYGVFAMPEGKNSDADWVHVLDVTAIMKWNGLTEKFDIVFTGAEEAGKTVIGEGEQTYPALVLPEGSELLAELPEHELYLYTQPDSWRPILQYGEHSVELDTAIEIKRNPIQFFPGDRNGDGITEIVMLYHKGWGTGYDAFGLAACWVDDGGLHVEYHDHTAIREEFNSSNTFSYDEARNIIFVTYGDRSTGLRLWDSYKELDWSSFQPTLVTSGDIVRYASISGDRWEMSLTPALYDGMPVLQYLPMYANYTIEFTGTEFRQVDSPTLTADLDGMLVQPYTVTPLENSPENPYYTDFELTLNGNSIQFSGLHLKIAPIEGDDILTYYFDMTGDGVPDPVVMLVRVYGSGPIKRDIHVFDGITLEEYDMSGLFNIVENAFTFTGDEDHFFITGENLSVTIPRADVNSYHSDFSQFVYPFILLDSMEIIDDSFLVTEKGGMLCANFACLVFQHEVMGRLSYGSVNAYMMLVDGKLTPVKLTFADVNGAETTGQSLTTIASLPEEDVYLYMDGEGNFTLQAWGHYGPIPDLNKFKDTVIPSSADHLSKVTATNLSGPDFEYIAFTLKERGVTTPITWQLIWNGERNAWDLFGYASALGTLPRDIVTSETYPENPEWYYKVAETDRYNLYARNHGTEIFLTYGNIVQKFDRVAHTGHMNLPVMEELDERSVAVISEVNTGTGVGVDELVVYRMGEPDNPMGFNDYLYDWRDLAADFNRNNTLTYDKLSNSLSLNWDGKTYNSGRMADDLSVGFGLEDGFTGALIATGDIIRFTANEDGTFTARMETSIAEGNNGSFSGWFWLRADEDSYVYPSSIGTTGLDLIWTVRFTGEGFEVVEPPTVTPSAIPEKAALLDSLSESGTYLYLDGSGQLWLRDGVLFARLNAELCNYTPSEFTVSLLNSASGTVTIRFENFVQMYEVSYSFILTEVYFESSDTSEMIWTPRVDNMPRF